MVAGRSEQSKEFSGAESNFLVIDDHIGMVAGRSEQSKEVQHMFEAFERGTGACRQAGIPHHSGKRVRAKQHGLALGGDLVEGRYLGSERMRRALLTVLSLTLARQRTTNGSLMRNILSSWTYCLLYRRPAMCRLGECFE